MCALFYDGSYDDLPTLNSDCPANDEWYEAIECEESLLDSVMNSEEGLNKLIAMEDMLKKDKQKSLQIFKSCDFSGVQN